MFQVLAVATICIFLARGDSVAQSSQRDFYRVTRRPTPPYAQVAKSDGYTSRPTPPYSGAIRGDSYFGFLRRFTRRPTSPYRYADAVKRDAYRYTRRPTPPYTAEKVKGDDFTRYFRRYVTKRPTSPYNPALKSDAYLQTRRPTRYSVRARGDVVTSRPTKPYTANLVKIEAAKGEKVEQAPKPVKGSQQMVPEPEVMDKKYFYVKSRLGWNDAQQACARRGAQLAMIHSLNEHERVGNVCQSECWLGADRSDVAGSFKWSDESSMDFENWDGNEPRHETKSGLCVKMSNSPEKKWTSADCDAKLGFVCQKMAWHAQLQASVESDSFAFASSFARGNVLSLAMMIVVAIAVGFLACNYMCFVVNRKTSESKKRSFEQNDDAASDETKPLLWTRA